MNESPQVGMRVRVLEGGQVGSVLPGDEGTICELYSDTIVGVDFSRLVGGHSCDGHCEDYCGWRMRLRDLVAVVGELWVPAVGERVLYTGPGPTEDLIDEPGVICHAPGRDDPDRSGVRFDRDISGHDCNSHCDRPHGWYCVNDQLRRETTPGDRPVPTVNTLFQELSTCQREIKEAIPAEIVNGTYKDLAVYVLDKDGEGVTGPEWQALCNALSAIMDRYKSTFTTSKPFIGRLLGRSPVDF